MLQTAPHNHHPAHVDGTQNGHAVVAMFSNNVAMATRGCYTHLLTHLDVETRGIEGAAAAHDAFLGEAADTPRYVRQDVDGIGDDQQKTVGAVLRELRDDKFEDFHVLLHERQTTFLPPEVGGGHLGI